MSGGTISSVAPGSVAAAIGLRPGDVLLEINGHPLRDVLDVQFYAADEALELVVRRADREIVYEVERDYGQPLGLDFAAPTFDGMRRCRNRCEFCFVQQMPPGYRRSLYVKDDDYRYSVLYGSYVTLTNLTEEDWARLEEQRLSPLYVSVHATDLDLRRELLGREDVPDILADRPPRGSGHHCTRADRARSRLERRAAVGADGERAGPAVSGGAIDRCRARWADAVPPRSLREIHACRGARDPRSARTDAAHLSTTARSHLGLPGG